MKKHPLCSDTNLECESVGKRIRNLRKLRGLTIKQLAASTASSMGYVSELENNPQKSISLRRLKAFAEALEIDEHVLLDGGGLGEIPEADREFVACFVALPRDVKNTFKALMEWYLTSRHK